MNSYMRDKCNKFATAACKFVYEEKNADRYGPKYIIRVEPVKSKTFNLFDSIRADEDGGTNGNVLIGNNIVRTHLGGDTSSLVRRLQKLPISHKHAKIDELNNSEIDEIFLSVSDYYKQSRVIKKNSGRKKLSKKQRDAYKRKYNFTCHDCGVNCSNQTIGYYLRRTYLIQLHHNDGNSKNNPSDESNWSLKCYTCHARQPHHNFMMNRNDPDNPGIDMNLYLNTLRREQGIPEDYNSSHGCLYEVVKIAKVEKISIWDLIKIKMSQITNFLLRYKHV